MQMHNKNKSAERVYFKTFHENSGFNGGYNQIMDYSKLLKVDERTTEITHR